MNTEARASIPRKVLEALAGLADEPGETTQGVALYPAGGLTRALLEHGLPGGIPILGVSDSNPALWGCPVGPFRVLRPSALEALGPGAILVASTRFHREIAGTLEAQWRERGIRIVDLCAGMGPLSELEDEAWRLGLELDASEPGILKINDPGPPRRQVRYRREAWATPPGCFGISVPSSTGSSLPTTRRAPWWT
jgi:hypothetical protein